MGRPRTPVAERFEALTCPEPNTGCLLWTAASGSDGYGCVSEGGRIRRAHRVAWELARGPIPDGMLVLHDCDTPACVNVAHLHLGTEADNMAEKVARGRHRTAARATPEQVATVLATLRADGTHAAAAQATGLSRITVLRILRREAPELIHGPRAGSRHVNAVLTDAVLASVRERLARGERQAAIARELGVSQPTISRAASRLSAANDATARVA